MSGKVSALDHLAKHHGIEPHFNDAWGKRYRVPVATKRALLAAMGVAVADDAQAAQSLDAARAADKTAGLAPAIVVEAGAPWSCALKTVRGRRAWSLVLEDGSRHQGASTPTRGLLQFDLALPPGYHRLAVEGPKGPRYESQVIAAPARAFGLGDLGLRRRLWGVTAPLYGLRTPEDWGLGNYADLGAFAEMAAGLGSALVGINPVHALMPRMPERASPYSPSSRLFLNPLHIAVEAVPEFQASAAARALVARPEFQADLAAVRRADLVDYTRVAGLQRQGLEVLFRHFRDHCGSETARGRAFAAFVAERGSAPERYATFEALFEHFHDRDPKCRSWQQWPARFHDPAGPAVQEFVSQHRDRVNFHCYLQWIAAEQLAAAQARAKVAGMALGLYLDLAVGVDPGGADAWIAPGSVAKGAVLGAPPDAFNPTGQNWGLAPFDPQALRRQAYAPFIALLRANMRAAGALRIDHIIGFQHSFWMPEEPDLSGAYVRYPLEELLAVIRLESHRQKCLVIGEDLGVVPRGFRDRLEAAGLLGYRVFYFERDKTRPRAAADYPRACVASVSTHDLPTLRGFFAGRDIDWREQLGIMDRAGSDKDRAARAEACRALVRLLAEEGLLPEVIDPRKPPAEIPWSIVVAVHRFLASTPAEIALMQIADATGDLEQENLPGTVEGHANWSRRSSLTIAELGEDHRLRALAEAIAAERPA